MSIKTKTIKLILSILFGLTLANAFTPTLMSLMMTSANLETIVKIFFSIIIGSLIFSSPTVKQAFSKILLMASASVFLSPISINYLTNQAVAKVRPSLSFAVSIVGDTILIFSILLSPFVGVLLLLYGLRLYQPQNASIKAKLILVARQLKKHKY